VRISKNPILIVVGLLALALIVASSCTKKAKAPNINAEPNTIITSYGINTLPDSATIFTVTVYWRASDIDGQPEYYRYWIGAADVADTLKIRTFDAFASVKLSFATQADVYTFNVESRDNEGLWDSSPATIQINMANDRHGSAFNPSTNPITVPANGTLTSRGVHFVIGAADLDGSIPRFQRAIDDTASWTEIQPIDTTWYLGDVQYDTLIVNPDSVKADTVIISVGRQSTLILNLTPTDLSLGSHIVYVRAVDNMGNVDESPLSISFIAVDNLRPDLSIVSGTIPNAFYFLPQGGNTVNLTTTWSADASWYYSTLQFRYAVDDTTTWSSWITADHATLRGLAAGSHQFFIQAMDQAGNTTTFSTNFGVGQLLGDEGVLVVNGIDWATYSPQPDNMYAANGPFGTHPIHFWDFFAGSQSYYPSNIASVFIGSGIIPGDSLGRFSSVVFCVNAFNNDDVMFTSMLPLIMSYLNGGGNVLLAARYASLFITGDLMSYGVSTPLEFNNIGVNPRSGGLVATVPGLVDIGGTGSWSLTDLLAPSTDPNVTTLFTTPDYPTSVGGIIIQPEGKGKFAFVAGRVYRMNFTAMSTDFDYILTHYFGEGGN
jgi:hypothetical protein